MKLRSTLYSFQREDVRRVSEFDGRALIASEVGTGKSLVALTYAWKYLPEDPPGPIIIVVPAHLRINWQREIRKHLDADSIILHGLKVPSWFTGHDNPNSIYILSYNSLVPPLWKSRTAPPEDSWLAWIAKQKPRLLIGDEGHFAKDSSSGRSRAFRRLARITPHVLILTGTPLANKPTDLWSLLNILRPELFPSQWDFNMQFAHGRCHWWGWEFKGAKQLDVLHDLLTKSCMIRRRKADVLSQLPAITHTVIPLEVDLREYRKAEMDFLGWLAQQAPQKTRGAMKAQELSKINHLKMLAGKLKVPAVVDWVQDFFEESDSKLLLGAIHYDVTEPIIEAFPQGSVLVDGRLSAKKKDAAFTKFNEDPHCRLLVGNVDAAGTGWSCKSTSDVAFVEVPWRPAEVTQFAGRVDGIERGLPGTGAHIRYLVAADTCESDLCEILQRKQEWANTAIDGGSGAELPVHDQVIAAMKGRIGKR